MKTIKLTISLILLAGIYLAKGATPNVVTKRVVNPEYEKILTTTLEKISNTKEITEQYDNVNLLKRLNSLYPNEWRTDYYIAYLDIKLFIAGDHTTNTSLLDEAEQEIAALHKHKDVNESEAYTLDGYLYYAKIILDPAKNGQLYYKEVLTNYQKAIVLDQNNPRPKLLLALFKQNMAKFMGGANATFCDELKGIEVTFNNFKPANVNDPKWGYKELLAIESSQCVK
jgi:hypothetical protein